MISAGGISRRNTWAGADRALVPPNNRSADILPYRWWPQMRLTGGSDYGSSQAAEMAQQIGGELLRADLHTARYIAKFRCLAAPTPKSRRAAAGSGDRLWYTALYVRLVA